MSPLDGVNAVPCGREPVSARSEAVWVLDEVAVLSMEYRHKSAMGRRDGLRDAASAARARRERSAFQALCYFCRDLFLPGFGNFVAQFIALVRVRKYKPLK